MVPITSDLYGYARFWTCWLLIWLVVVVTYLTAIVGVLVAIYWKLR